jgi:hypothetical protein
MSTQTSTMITQFLQSTDVQLTIAKNADGSLSLQAQNSAGGITATTAPASDVAALLTALGAA